MLKRLVYQINVPNAGRTDKLTAYTYMSEMYVISERNARKYAARCGADYYKVETLDDWKPGAGKHLDYQKLKALDFTEYDQIIYFDSDYVIKDNAPNLFDICQNKFSACTDPGKAVSDLARELGIPADKYFNAGFMYLTKDALDIIRPKAIEYLEKCDWPYQGQGLLNKLFYDCNVHYNPLPSHDWNPVNRCFGTYADHYAGAKKRNWGKITY